MKAYSALERKIANALGRFPAIKRCTKRCYAVANYIAGGRRVSSLELAQGVRLVEDLVPNWESLRPDCYFFGYYDKSPWSSCGRYFLLHGGTTGDRIDILVLDQESGQVCLVGRSGAWNWQQGAMAQWLPGASHSPTGIFNTIEGERLGARIVTVGGPGGSFLPWPVQAIHPSGDLAISLNYRRLSKLRRDYGYGPHVRNFVPFPPLAEDGLWKVHLKKGTADLLLTLADLQRIKPGPQPGSQAQKVNHVIFSPDGSRFVFVHRWFDGRGKASRLFVTDTEGRDPRLLFDEGMVSHYHWQDNSRLLVWARTAQWGDRYYLVDVATGERQPLGYQGLDRLGDGHPSFSPDGRWIVTDTYPDRARQQALVLCDITSAEVVEVGRFLAPLRYDGIRRCDLHPRWSPDGRFVSIDSAHDGTRRSYIVDLTGFMEGRGER